MTELRQVTREDFFAPIYAKNLDVHPTIVTDRYPYASEWRLHRQIGTPLVGKTVGRLEGGLAVQDYFLVA